MKSVYVRIFVYVCVSVCVCVCVYVFERDPHTFHAQKQRQVGLFPLRPLSQDAAQSLEVQQTQGHLFQQLAHLWYLHMR